MPQITIDGILCTFDAGETILDIASRYGIEIPHYCFHEGLTAPANCRICLAEVWAPNPRNDNVLEEIPKLLPTCRTDAGDGQVVYLDSPRAIANQKAVMEYLLINHPVDCAVCDQAGECYLQDYAYQYGRAEARFEEVKIKQPKKDIGPHVLLYADRCIMCTRCVRFTREVTGTGELMVEGRGAHSEIDVFPGMALDNELSGNVVDICPVGALLDKDFLFQQRVWYLKQTPAIDPITASGDNLWIDHNDGKVWRLRPRRNLEVNRFWMTDEVRYGWKFVHSDDRLTMPRFRDQEEAESCDAAAAWTTAIHTVHKRLSDATSIALMVSPMLTCEDAHHLDEWIESYGANVIVGVGPVPFDGKDKTFLDGYTMYAEKAPNARGVRRILESTHATVHDFDSFLAAAKTCDAVVLTGNYPSTWHTPEVSAAINGTFSILIDCLNSSLTDEVDVVLPAATFAEKSGCFQSVTDRVQSFSRAISPIDFVKAESQIALDMLAAPPEGTMKLYAPAASRAAIAKRPGLDGFDVLVDVPEVLTRIEPDMQYVDF
jgi:NADH-quinone oxidoreductase subunit G